MFGEKLPQGEEADLRLDLERGGIEMIEATAGRAETHQLFHRFRLGRRTTTRLHDAGEIAAENTRHRLECRAASEPKSTMRRSGNAGILDPPVARRLAEPLQLVAAVEDLDHVEISETLIPRCLQFGLADPK